MIYADVRNIDDSSHSQRYWIPLRDFANSMVEVLPSIGAVVLIMIIYLTIVALLGMQILGGRFVKDSGHPRTNYDSFGSAFLTSFQVMTGENWNEVRTWLLFGERERTLTGLPLSYTGGTEHPTSLLSQGGRTLLMKCTPTCAILMTHYNNKGHVQRSGRGERHRL